jgi:hypothetical protein
MNRYVVLGILLVVALGGQASAGTFYRYISPATTPVTVAGIVSATGQVEHGSGFAVHHPATGEYDVTFQPGFFPSGCAVMIVQTWGSAPVLGNARVGRCAARDPVFHVILQATDGTLRDAHFQFIAAGT